jgi:hypothetical protein
LVYFVLAIPLIDALVRKIDVDKEYAMLKVFLIVNNEKNE